MVTGSERLWAYLKIGKSPALQMDGDGAQGLSRTLTRRVEQDVVGYGRGRRKWRKLSIWDWDRGWGWGLGLGFGKEIVGQRFKVVVVGTWNLELAPRVQD